MKRYLIILLVLLASGCANKAPAVRLTQMYIDSQQMNYDLAMHIKSYMYGSLAITPSARDYINNMGSESVEAQKVAINQLYNYRAGDADLDTLEYEIQDLSRKQVNLITTIKAFMMAAEFNK